MRAFPGSRRSRLPTFIPALAAAVLCGATPVLGQSVRVAANGVGSTAWVHESWTTKDGLPVNAINWIMQSRDGYIWAATFDGLVRFDGVRFTTFNSANTDGLPSNRITSLYEARNGDLWLETEQSHLVRLHAGRAVVFDSTRGLPPAFSYQFAEDVRGQVWIATADGVYRVNGDRVVRDASSPRAPVVALVGRRDSSVWVAFAPDRASGDPVTLVRRAVDGRVTRILLPGAPAGTAVRHLHENEAGVLWVFTDKGVWTGRQGLRPIPSVNALDVMHVIDGPGGRGVLVHAMEGVYRGSGDSLLLIDARAGRRPQRRRLWTVGGASWYAVGRDVLREGELVYRIPEDEGAGGTGEFWITVGASDREGSIWFGTNTGGLHRIKPALFRTYGAREGVVLPNVYPTLVDTRGRVWAGMWGRGLVIIDEARGQTLVHDAPAVGQYPFALMQDGDRMLVGATGLASCTLDTIRCTKVPVPPPGTGPILALHRDARGLWVGTASGVILDDGERWRHFTAADGAPVSPVRGFLRTRDGALWMATNGSGLARFADGRFTRVARPEGLPSDLVRALYEDADGILWVGTEGRGLARVDPRGWRGPGAPAEARRIVRIGAREGLLDDVIHQILDDEFGRLWMSTNRGIFWVSRAELEAFARGAVTRVYATAYSERDGLLNREANGGMQPAGDRGPDGRLWFPTQNGVAVVDPRLVRADRAPPPVVVEQVSTTDTTIFPTGAEVTLAPMQRDVQIAYTALTFLEPGNVRFRYRLDKFDADWVNVGARRTAFYTKLPPGRYTFRVQGTNATGEWPDSSATLLLHVSPRWWETRSFRLLLVAVLVGVLAFAMRRRVRTLRTRTAQLEQVVAERTASLSEREQELARQNALLEAQATKLQELDSAKTRFFANVSHELRTPLTLTIGPLEDLRTRSNRDPQEVRWIDIALRNSRRLLRLVNQILDVAKLEAGQMQLRSRPLDLAAFVRGIVGTFGSVAERKRIALSLDAPVALRGTFDGDAVEKILSNLLSNAVKFTPDGGTVRVLLREEGTATRTVRLQVVDSGPGIPPVQLEHVFERFYRVDEASTGTQAGTGIGLALVKELVELHGGVIGVESDPRGTMFTVDLPYTPVSEAPAPDPVEGPITGQVRLTPPYPEEAVDESPDVHADVPTMLVVDDSDDLRLYVRDHFASQFRVLEARDGAEGLAVARRELPDVVVSDVMMPGVDGFSLVRALRASPETEFLAIILLTAQAEDEKKFTGLASGADEYLVKPFDMRELELRVRNLITARRRLRERFADRFVERATVSPVVAVEEDATDIAATEAADRSGSPVDEAPLSSVDRAFAERVRTAIAERLSNPDFGVAELAEAVAQDRSHLFRRVKQVFGVSPSLLMRRMRLEAAEELLASGRDNVADVAYAVGFNSVSYFCQCFQQQYGDTPAAYRGKIAGKSALP
jgi:signal transduction histidine kinase/ligand-binding sensor domain-containing protein/CheY-like chemotaxis protein/AraC-like DNA-binding protein